MKQLCLLIALIPLLLFVSLVSADEPVRERIEWIDIWVTDADKSALPRVLLVGDSITRGYFGGVEKHLAGKAHCARLTTSKCVSDPTFDDDLKLLLKQYQFSVIHINNGLHGWGYTENEYRDGLLKTVLALKEHAGDATLIWGTTTPVRETSDLKQFAERTERVKARNQLAAEIMQDQQIPTDDLFELVKDHAEWTSGDGVHFNGGGNEALAKQVAASVLEHLPSTAEARTPEPTMRTIETNGIKLRIAEAGSGPLVIFVHGWPESWYSWRHQLPAVAAAGYHAVAPDMRGYGKSDKPAAVEDYDIQHLTADLVGLVDALGEKQAVLVGHDWGAIVAWHAMLLHPERFRALVAMSVPYMGRPSQSLVQSLKTAFGDNFFYILYFQEPGAAEAEFDADPRGIISRLYLSPDSPREAPEVTDPKRAAGGWIPRLGAPKGLPAWLSQADLDYYVNEFKEAGFRGGINYYRNFHRNWETTPELADAKVSAPVLFVAGDKDVVIRGATAEKLSAGMQKAVPGLRAVKLIPNTGHWVQQERPEEVNAAIVAFLKEIDVAGSDASAANDKATGETVR